MTPVAPLAGVRVLDLGQVWAGPLLGCYLSDFGAEVIRVESRTRAGMQSGAPSPATDPADPRAYDSLFRNRRSVALDLDATAGRTRFLQLVMVSDVVFDNLSPAAVSKLGIGYEALREANPAIIAVSMSAAGRSGPWSDVLTYGPSLTALYGIKSLLGYPGEQAIMEDVADLDPTAATYAMIAIAAALRYRERTGRGQFVDMAQGEAGVASLAEAVIEYGLNRRVLGPTGNRHRMIAPHGIYPCRTAAEATHEGWIAIAVEHDGEWQALCRVLDRRAEATDPRFRDRYSRLRHQDELDALLVGWTAAFEADALAERLQAEGVAAYPVLDAYGAIYDEQLTHRRTNTRVTAEALTDAHLLTGTPWRMSRSPATIHGPARPLGADDGQILGELLGGPVTNGE